MAERTCSIDGCHRLANSGRICTTHRYRLNRTGTTDPPVFKREPWSETNGYLRTTAPGHVLSGRSNSVISVHRLVLFDAIGYGPHRCHWCTTHVGWRQPGADMLTVDHLDNDRANNDRANLVQSCIGCNVRRRSSRLRALRIEA
jgi:hypothetical protein